MESLTIDRRMDLPNDVLARVLSWAGARSAGRAASVSRAWRATSGRPSLWTALCEAAWPSVATPALGQLVALRGPRNYYERRVALRVAETPDLLDFDDILFTVDITQGDAVLSSTVHEGASVLRDDVQGSDLWNSTALHFDGLSARIACAGDEFPPVKSPVTLSICAVRKSDGLVALLFCWSLDTDTGYPFGPDNNRGRRFPSAPSLSGYLPITTIGDLSPCGEDFAQRWALNQGRVDGETEGPEYLEAGVNIGTISEFPNQFPNGFVAPDDPSVIVHSDSVVEIRRFVINFSLAYYLPDPDDPDEGPDLATMRHFGTTGAGLLDRDAIRRVLADRLRFR